jgi:virginiamycin B lyase
MGDLAAKPLFRLHKIPTPNSEPYICVPGPDGCLWFCESGASKVGRLNPANGLFEEFALRTPDAKPIGITAGADGNVWFSETDAGQIGRITPTGEITEFKQGITEGCRPLSIATRDNELWFSEAAGRAA